MSTKPLLFSCAPGFSRFKFVLSALYLLIPTFLVLVSDTAYSEPCRQPSNRTGHHSASWPVNIHLGVRGSLNWVTFYGEDADNQFAESTFRLRHIPAPGVVVGILSANDFLKWRGGLELDVSYVTKGSGVAVDGEERGSLDFRYYDLTLLARFERETGKNLHGYLLLGPGLGLLGEAINVYPSGQDDVTDETTDRDLRMVAGVGIRWVFRPSHHFTFDMRTDIGTRTIDATINNNDFKNFAISLSLGYQWSYPPRQRATSCPDP